MTNDVASYFERFIARPSLFLNKKALSANHSPERIEHREEQTKRIAQIIAPALRGEKPSNLFLYGKTGTGKTLTVHHTIAQLKKVAAERAIALSCVYVNCKLKRVADTEYRLIAEICRHFGKAVPPTGLPTDEVYNIFHRALEERSQIVLLVLDEVDQLVGKAGDELLYNLTRINSALQQTELAIIGISNDIRFIEYLDPRVKSSLSEEEIIFPPYNALQLQSILRLRSADAFTSGALEEGVLEKCAAVAAREHGDARRALELLRVAAETAEREGSLVVRMTHLDHAEQTIERDRVLDMVKAQPTQYQAALYSILVLNERQKESIFTGDIYEQYCTLCAHAQLRPLTQRRISDIIAEYDLSGIIQAKIISKGRYGRTREIALALPPETHAQLKQILQEELSLTG